MNRTPNGSIFDENTAKIILFVLFSKETVCDSINLVNWNYNIKMSVGTMSNQKEQVNPETPNIMNGENDIFEMKWNSDDIPKGSRRRLAKSGHHHRHSSSRSHSSHSRHHSTSHRASHTKKRPVSHESLSQTTWEELLYQKPENDSVLPAEKKKQASGRSAVMTSEKTVKTTGNSTDQESRRTESERERPDPRMVNPDKKTTKGSNEHHEDRIDNAKSSVGNKKPQNGKTVSDAIGNSSETRLMRPAKKDRKKHPLWLKILIVTVVVLLCLILGGTAFVFGNLNKISREQSSVVPTPDPDAIYSDDDSGKDGSVVYEDFDRQNQHGVGAIHVDPIYREDVKNILLIGQDRRTGDGGRMRADSIIIATINLSTNKIELTSLMRDMYLPVPGYGYGMINATYLNGGIALLDETIQKNFGITIDGNLQLDFTRFIGLMDMVGPIEIDLRQEEADYLNKGYGWSLKAGRNTMNSEQVLAYCRTRQVGRSDWERTDRQRSVVTKIFNKLKGSDLSTLYAFANEAFPLFRTDLSNTEILQYVYTVISRSMAITESRRIPIEGSYTQGMRDGSLHVLIPNLEANAQALQEYCYGYSNVAIENNQKQVAMQNGSKETDNSGKQKTSTSESSRKETKKKNKVSGTAGSQKTESSLVIDE